ncbi:hypothetical protein LguiB_017083 [Lonicera macranthoides]
MEEMKVEREYVNVEREDGRKEEVAGNGDMAGDIYTYIYISVSFFVSFFFIFIFLKHFNKKNYFFYFF